MIVKGRERSVVELGIQRALLGVDHKSDDGRFCRFMGSDEAVFNPCTGGLQKQGTPNRIGWAGSSLINQKHEGDEKGNSDNEWGFDLHGSS